MIDRIARVAVLLAITIPLSSTSFAQGDLVMQGHNLGPTGANPTIDAIGGGALSSALSVASTIDPTAAAELSADISGGNLCVGTADMSEGNYGTHDDNTIALEEGNDATLNGIALLHEWQHVKNARADGTTNDMSTGTTTNPCGPLLHADMIRVSADQACEAASDPNISDDEKEAYCAAYANFKSGVGSAIDKAKDAGCPTDPLPVSDMQCSSCS